MTFRLNSLFRGIALLKLLVLISAIATATLYKVKSDLVNHLTTKLEFGDELAEHLLAKSYELSRQARMFVVSGNTYHRDQFNTLLEHDYSIPQQAEIDSPARLGKGVSGQIERLITHVKAHGISHDYQLLPEHALLLEETVVKLNQLAEIQLQAINEFVSSQPNDTSNIQASLIYNLDYENKFDEFHQQLVRFEEKQRSQIGAALNEELTTIGILGWFLVGHLFALLCLAMVFRSVLHRYVFKPVAILSRKTSLHEHALDQKPIKVNSPIIDICEMVRNYNNMVTKIGITIENLNQEIAVSSKLSKKAEAANKAKNNFLANISHELRTPLHGLSGLHMLLADTKLSQEQQGYLQQSRASVEALLAIINEILDFAQMESGKLTIKEQPIRTQKLFANVCDIAAPLAQSKRLGFSFNICELLPETIHIDSLRFEQVMMNVIGNSIKFTDTGQVDLSVTYMESQELPQMRIVICDTGIGMSEEQISRIFLPFEQADISTTRKYGGTGLGLAIASDILNRMGGEISFTSEMGKGSECTMYIPLRTSSEQAKFELAEHKQQEYQQILLGKRVLLTEDNQLNQLVAKSIINKLGGYVDIATNGEMAIVNHKAKPYDLIFMDIQMPIMDGFEATKLLRDENHIQVPIIGLSADAQPSTRQQAKEVGMTEFLTKPFNFKQLYELLNQLEK